MTDCWTLAWEGLDWGQESLREALCAVGNGFFVTRGAAEEAAADGVHYPGTYVGGGYNCLVSEIAGRQVPNEDLVNFPNWLPLTFRPAGGSWLDLRTMEVLAYRQELRMRDGLLVRSFRVRDEAGRISRVESRRFVHMGAEHVAALQLTLVPENWSGTVEVKSAIDGAVRNAGVARYRQLRSEHLQVTARGAVAPEGIYLVAETVQSRFVVAEAARTRLFTGGRRLEVVPTLLEEEARIAQCFTLEVQQEEPLLVEKVAVLYSSKDRGILEPGHEARTAIAEQEDFEEILPAHLAAWRALWRRFDLEMSCRDGDNWEQRILRLHIFHLLQTVSENTIGRDVGVPARGLHGEAYRGHVFWDELFIFPTYNLRSPSITRSLLLYRYHRLEAARRHAREEGLAGALYPWQSSSDGREASQLIHLNPRSGRWDPDHSRLQRHINAAVAYNIWLYQQITADQSFLERYGAEMLLEIARCFASLAKWNEAEARYEILGVMGPDEYHEGYPGAAAGGLRNNTYTNVMAVWCIERALEALERLRPERREELVVRLELEADEVERWRHITERMKLCFLPEGVLAQFEGYEALEELDWDRYRDRYGHILRLDRILKAEGDTPDRYKVSKQADVTMLFYLLSTEELQGILRKLGYDFDDDAMRANVAYYLPRTANGSTLSLVAHAAVMDRIDREAGWQMWQMALRSDVEDIQGGTTGEGIHLGAMSGTVDIVIRQYLGVEMTRGVLSISPRLPDKLRTVRARIEHRNTWLTLEVDAEGFELEVEEMAPAPVRLEAWGELVELGAGEKRRFPRPPGR